MSDTKDADGLPFLPLWVGDYLRDTRHLSPREHGIYLLLLMHYWSTGSLPRIPDSDLLDLADQANASFLLERCFRLCSCTEPEDRVAMKFVLEEFFDWDGRTWRHGRLEQDREKAFTIRKKRREAGARGGRRRQQMESPGIANGQANGSAFAQAEGVANSKHPQPQPQGIRDIPPRAANVPDWFDWPSYIAFRADMAQRGWPVTNAQLDKIIEWFEEKPDRQLQQEQIFNQSIRNGWKSLQDIPKERGNGNGQNRRDSAADRVRRAAEAIDDE